MVADERNVGGAIATVERGKERREERRYERREMRWRREPFDWRLLNGFDLRHITYPSCSSPNQS
jgi:hypothetical protein